MNRGGLIERLFGGRLWLCPVVGLALTLTACLSPEEKCLNTMREAVYADDFEKGLATADAFYRKHAVETEHPPGQAMALRWEISAYTRLCLLMTGELNRRFLAYYPVREMEGMFPGFLPMREWFCYARLYYEMELYGQALLFVLWHIELCDWDYASIDLLLNIFRQTRQWRSLQIYLYALKNNPKTKKWVKSWEKQWHQIETSALKDTLDGTWPLPLSDKFLISPDGPAFLDGYVKGAAQHSLRQMAIGDTVPSLNIYLTDYYTLLCLLEKDLSKVPLLADIYQSQDRIIPDYLQEAIYYLSHSSFSPFADSSVANAVRISPAIRQRVENVLYDYKLFKIGALPFEDFKRRHAATYTYYLLFGLLP